MPLRMPRRGGWGAPAPGHEEPAASNGPVVTVSPGSPWRCRPAALETSPPNGPVNALGQRPCRAPARPRRSRPRPHVRRIGSDVGRRTPTRREGRARPRPAPELRAARAPPDRRRSRDRPVEWSPRIHPRVRLRSAARRRGQRRVRPRAVDCGGTSSPSPAASKPATRCCARATGRASRGHAPSGPGRGPARLVHRGRRRSPSRPQGRRATRPSITKPTPAPAWVLHSTSD